MLARNHRIRIGTGMIGWSIANARSRISQAAKEDDVRLATPELPDTLSEAALPLRSRGKVLGALTVQSDRFQAFDDQTLTVLQIMADQVAIAIDNAQLFAESQVALEAERRAYGEIGREAWEQLFQTRPDWGYVFTGNSLSTSEGDWKPEMEQAAETGQIVINKQGVLAIPIKVREQVIGVLNFQKPANTQDEFRDDGQGATWQPEEIATLESIIAQVGQAIEGARLYQETRRRAARDRLTGEITTRMRSSLDMDTVLQTAIREIADRLAISQVEVHLGSGPIQDN
jgi:GAF domain-containing protein